jgi:hypothetical protein
VRSSEELAADFADAGIGATPSRTEFAACSNMIRLRIVQPDPKSSNVHAR